MSRIPLRAIAAVCMSMGAAHAVAQSPETIIVTAARSAQPLSASLADTTVIGEDEIQRSTGQSLPQLLQRQPGLEVTVNGGPGGTSGVFIRGANSAQALVLVDGLRVGSSSTGATSLEAIPLDQIERIEIVRGPASSLYGADAMGGVIQVFTKSGSPGFAAQASAGYGTDATRNLSAGLRGGTGMLRYSLQAGATKSEGFNAIVNPANFSYNPDRDGYEASNVGGSLAFDWAAGQTLELHGLHNRL
ncbi:MAG TPA: TonB-dependent receptor plug domain-containing protein, partial [Usitatibacter sp.]|nr:TonB-dependent receptor plug domain-containing protein [Usitatibacter sp.]